jgi:hypothetical protein
MKALTVLSAIQTVGILVLIAKLFAIEPATLSTTAAPAPTVTSQRVATATQLDDASTATQLDDASTATQLDDASGEALRAVIREEVATQVHEATRQMSGPAMPPKPRDPEADRVREERVAQHIETYKSVGAITDQQMEDLQLELARLDQPTRRALMSKLVKAMNSGEIKGRF